ncbi:hypothetical protein WJX72_012482 [[Myrmecia] bisecta]|uniref:Uncharacterized protein n=1 Tax=[Myrmecia] bisecta TaxID=41462 RepID=A0AAW1QT84_9CHLO
MADNGKEVTPAQAAPGSDAQPAPKPPAAQQAPAAALPQPSPAAQGGAAGGSASVPVGPATGKRLSLGAGSAAKGDDSDVILQRLREFVEKEGGQWDEGWRVEKKMRASGNTAGTFDVYYFSPGGKRFRSRTEVARFLGLAPEPEKKSGKAASGKAAASKPAPIVTFSREEAVQRAKDAAGDLAMHVPLLLPDGVTVTRLGEADPRPAYHTATQLWPVGYEARVADAQVGTFVCVIRDGGAGGPIFRVRLDPAGKDNGAKLLAEGKDPGDVWSKRSSWEAEERRLNKEAERWRKLGNKANKGVEKKEKQLGSAVDKAEKKRKRETDKEPAQGGARGSAKAPRKQEGRAGEAAAAVNGPGSGRKAVRRRSGVGTYRKQGTTELEKDVGHVMDKLLDKIEAAAEREARREEAKQQRRREHEAEKEARAAQRAAQRQEAKSEKERAKEAAKGERRHQAGAERDARLAASGTSLDVSDELLPGAQNPPPPPQPIGSGKLAPELSGAVVEVWEFLGRFSELLQVDAPHLAALEAALAEPQGENAQVVAAAALPLLDLLVSEAVEAALDLTAEANPDVKRRDLGGAFPPVREDCWTEVTRRYLDLCGASRMVASSEASGGLDTALGTLVGSAPLAVLGPAVTLQTLMTGPRGGDPRSGLAGLPLGASRSAPDAIMVRQDAASLAAAEQLLREAGGPAAAAEAAAQTRTKKACRHILWDLFNLLGPKDHTGAKATCRTLCYEGNAAAAAARTARPLDLMTVAARVDQGVYSRMDDGLAAFASDVRGVCETMRAACRRANSPFAARMAERRASEMADLLEATLDSLVDKHGSGSAGNTKTAGRTAHELANGDSKEEGGEPAAAANGLAGVPGQERSSAVDDVSRPFQPVEGCCMCWANEDPHRILLCDGCDAGYHIYCLDPPLGEIPAGEWYCPACARERQLHQKLPFAHRHVDLAEDDCWTAAQQLGQHTAAELGPACLVAILSLLAGLASCTAATRQHLLSQEEKRKELRKELVELRVRLKREENERLNEERERLAAAHQAAKPAGEAAAGPGPVPEPSAAVAAKQGGREGAAGGKAAKGTKRKAGGEAGEEGEGQAERKPRTRGAGGEGEQLVPEVALARMEELVLQIQRLVGRREPLGYDRHWNRYWLLGSPASPIGSVFVEARPGGKAPQDDCPPSSAEGSQTVATSSAAATASAWGCYQTVAQLEQLIEFLNVRGAREGPLRKALQKPGEAFDAVRGSAGRLARWRALVEGAKGAQALLAGLVVLEGALRGDRLKPWWRLWAFPTPDIEAAGTCAAVRLRLHALRAAIKRGGAAAAQREPASYAHAGGGYSFRQASRLAPGALAEKSFGGGTDDSGAEDSDAGGRRPAKRTRFGQRAAGDSKVAQGDAALAWQLQQELNSSRRAARAGGRAPGGDARETRHSSRLHPAQDDRRRSGRHSGSASGKGKRTPRDTPNTSAPASDASDDDLQVNEDSGSNSDGPAPMRKTRAQLAREELEEPGSEEKPATVAVHGRRRLRKAA